MEIRIPVDDPDVVWSHAAEQDLRALYRRYARERKLSELASLLNEKYCRQWTANAIGKKAARMGL